MKTLFTFFSRKVNLFFALFLLSGTIATAQLKIGDNPTSIQKSAILELESNRQGLLLTRLSAADTIAINLLLPPDGMIIYLTTDNSLRLRSGGSWKKIADLAEASANWGLTGNTGTDSATNFLGTADGVPLTIKTSNLARMIISSDGNIGIGTTTPTARFNVDGSVKFQNLAAGTNELEVLVLNPDGSVYRRTMSSSAFENAIKAINGIQAQTLSILATASDTSNNVLVQNRPSDSTIALFLPVQNGSAGADKPYGFLTYSDWQKIDTATQVIAIGAVATTSNAFGASVTSTDSMRTIILHPADVTNPGIVTAGAQTFGGAKTFAGDVTLDGTLTMNNITNNSTEDSVLVINNGLIQKRQVNAAAFEGAIRSINGNRDSIQGIAFHNDAALTDLTVTTALSTGPGVADSIFLNVPDAGLLARGVVTTESQNFAGTKLFQDSVLASTSLLVGIGTAATSTVQVNGSLSMAIRTIAATSTLTVADNTILANTTAGTLTVNLPATTGIAGRIYTIKKIGSGGIDNALVIAPTGGTIDGGASLTIFNDYSYVTLQTDGTNWYIIKK